MGLLSDVVLTFTPPDAVEGRRLALEVEFHDPGVHFTGPAKSVWKHAIRIGVDAGDPYNGICDWWAQPRSVSESQVYPSSGPPWRSG